ncbi:MAG: EAL domain-containing protein [Acidithiobacillus sp.]|jgi:diguanylate cyclase (GGDEF)-like protein/PAS domain S-box-containing protein|uniref:bifunctional diguanylate cyclase/phosphodiesterase n=1 Tax=Acidithiobacillus ferrooxidans TaxID=920 RepID=UPI000A5F58E0|nr:EAL domain-containing protein [Acidithiobacillus ferrooxidans]MDA8153333.1 EAL domain-containing protein [Acidithiobacillus sp.]
MLPWLLRAWLLFVVIVLLAGGGLAYETWQEVCQEYSTNLRVLAAAVADGTHLFLKGTQSSLAMLGQDTGKGADATPLAIHEKLQDYLVLEPNFNSVGVRAVGNGVVTAGMDKGLVRALLTPQASPVARSRITVQQRQLIQRCEHASGLCVGPALPVQNPEHPHHPHWVIPLFLGAQGTPYRHSVVSNIVALLPLQHGQFPFWRNLPLPALSSVFLLRRDGFLESRYPPPTQNTFGAPQNGIAAESIRAHPQARSATFYGLATAVNQWRLGAWNQVRGYPLVAGAGLPRSFLLATWWNRMTGPLAAMLALLLLSSLGYWTFRRIGEDRQRERSAHDLMLWESKERAEVTLHSIGDGVVTTDTQGRVTDVNPVAESMLGYARSDILGKPLETVFRIVHERDHQPVENPIRRVLQEGRVVALANHTVLLRADGQELAIEDSAAPIHGRDGQLLGAVLVFHDVTERRRLTKNLVYQAHHDDLTGLPNRKWFLERLQQATQEQPLPEGLLLVGILDLDGFKQVNDRWGHDRGDQLLCTVAQRIRETLRPEDIVSRLGGDEFGLLLPNMHHLEDAQHLAHSLIQALNQPIVMDTQVANVSASIGFTILSGDTGDALQILRHADLALYAAKARGRNQYCFYEKTLDVEQEQLMEILAMTEEALEAQSLVMYYQPVVTRPAPSASPEQGVIGFEALIRLQHPQRGLLTPAVFAEALDHPRLARRIGCFVLDAVLAQGEQWHQAGLPLRLSLNISARHLLDPEFLNDLQRALAAYPGIAPAYCEIEVTESAPMLDFQKAQEMLQHCNAMGLRIALDDFGTGNASLSYLQKLPAQTIKIDQSFVLDMLNDPRDFAIVAGVAKTARMLGLEVIAEGVETVGHLQLLETLDCPAMQGYLFAKPMPAEAVPAWVKSYNISNYAGNYKTSPRNNFMDVTDMGLLGAHQIRVEQSVQYLQGNGRLPERILGIDDAEHCHLALWLDQLPDPAALPVEVDQFHHRLHQMLRDHVSPPGSPEALQLAQELLETNAQLMDALHRFLGNSHVR